MRSEDILHQRFTTTRYQPGYEPREVDVFLQRAAEALRRHEGVSTTAEASLDAHEVESVRFTETRRRAGYDQLEVDEFLDALADALRRLEGCVANG